jgi:hypothetical protein
MHQMLGMLIMSRELDNYQKHAVREMTLLGFNFDEDGYPVEDPNEDFDMNAEMAMCVMQVLETFSGQGHSGMSASYAISILKDVMRFEPLSPLTGEDHEWNYINDDRTDNNPIYQNNRCSHVFKENGEAYDIDGKIFIDPDGASYTSSASRVPVVFPYTPKSIRVKVDADGNELPDE